MRVIERATLRPARQDDIPAIITLCADAHKESPRYRLMTFDADKIDATLRGLIGTTATGPSGFVNVIVKGEDHVAVMVGVMQDQLFGPDLTAREVFLYVAPEHRKSLARYNMRLIAAFERWGAANGAVEFVCGSSTGVATKAAQRMYEFMGYGSFSFSMVKRRGA